MTKKSLIPAIENLGLSENEAKVYLASLSVGPSSVLEITRKASMHRTTVYAVIEILKRKGLMHEEVRGLKTKFIAENPEKLETILDQKRIEFKSALPELVSLYNILGEEGSFKVYEGIEAVKNLYDSILKDLAPHDEWLAISDTERWFNLDPTYFEKFVERRAKLGVATRLILQESAKAREFKTFERNFGFKVKIVPKEKDFKMSLLVTPKHLLLHALTPPISGILIKNPGAVDMQRQVFNLIWEALSAGD